MKGLHILTFLGVFGLAGCTSLPSARDIGEQRLDAQTVMRLFTDKTVESYNRNNGMTSFTYYHPDGSVLQQRFWSFRRGSWRVMGDGKICLKFDKERCRPINMYKGEYYKVIPGRRRAIRYRHFIDGNLLLAKGKRWPHNLVFRP